MKAFIMKDEESVDDMFGRFQVLLNNMEALGQTYCKAQIKLKVLDSFLKVWKPKTTTIQEARDLKNLAWDELLGILRVHEVHLQNREHLQKKNSIALKYEETIFKREENASLSKALKVQMQESDGLDNSDGSIDHEVALMSKNFKHIMKKKGKFQHSSKHKDSIFKKKNKEESNEIIWFECRKPTYMKVECPWLKKKRYFGDKKKKSLMVTWDDSDNDKSGSLDDELANICPVVDKDDKVKIKTCSKFATSSFASLDDEEGMLYNVLLQNCHMISLQCKNFKGKFKAYASKTPN